MGNAGMTREQKWSVVILSFGTFLEYFDLMLYVHMSTLLNELFFPKTDPTVAQLLAATAFCTTYLLRPIGGLFIGWIGDKWGRKFTITLTTFIAAAACFIMVFTPEYKEKGIIATAIVILARALQGFSSLGEIAGAQLYMTETLKIPYKCVASGIIVWARGIGGLFALSVTSFVLSSSFSWRYAFVFGAFVAVIGVFARLRLRETPEFVNYQKRIAKKIQQNNQDIKVIRDISFGNEKVDKKAVLAFAFTEWYAPICFYVAIVYLGDFMKKSLGMTPAEVATHNLKMGIFTVLGTLFIIYLVKKLHPIKIAIVIALFFIVGLPFIPYWLDHVSNLFSLFCLQSIIISFSFSTFGFLDAIQYKYFPISKRFTIIATTFGITGTFSRIFTAFSLIPLTHYFGYYALWIVFTPAVIGYLWALYYFRKLEIERGLYYDYPCEEPGKPDTILEDHRYDDESYLGDEYEPFRGSCKYSIQLLNDIKELNKMIDRKVNINAVKHGITFAKRWHHGQIRKIGEPFYSHPIAVAELASEYYFKTDIIVAALLHDTIEDCKGCTLDLIEEKFNARIAQIVNGLTKYQKVDGKEKKLTLKETLERLYKAKDYETLFIKEMDRVHNLQTTDGLKPEKRKKMVEETIKYMLPGVAYVCEKLGIHKKIHLENKLFKPCYDILSKENSQ